MRPNKPPREGNWAERHEELKMERENSSVGSASASALASPSASPSPSDGEVLRTEDGSFQKTGWQLPPEDLDDMAIRLDTMRRVVTRWVEFNTEMRAKEGLSSDDDTHLICPPCWPSHGQLNNWAAALAQAIAVIGGERWMA